MIEMKCHVEEKLAQVIEDVLLEWEGAPFSIMKESETGEIGLHGYFQSEEEGLKIWKQLNGYVKDLPETVEIFELEDKEWQEAYKDHLKPWVYKGLHWVPVWEKEKYKVPAGEKVVYLDAGMAFGTGAHETTRLCGMRLMDYFLNGGKGVQKASVMDAGCGSGILALTASGLRFKEVYAFDIDPDAIRVAKENAGYNDLENGFKFAVNDLKEGLTGRKADFIMANIQADVLCKYANEFMEALNGEGILVLSGILVGEIQGVLAVFMKSGKVKNWESQQLGDWGDLKLCK